MTRRTVGLLIALILPSFIVSGLFWLGGWNFERGVAAAMAASLSILFGCMLAALVSEHHYD